MAQALSWGQLSLEMKFRLSNCGLAVLVLADLPTSMFSVSPLTKLCPVGNTDEMVAP